MPGWHLSHIILLPRVNHWMRTLDVNLKGVMLCVQYALPVMRDRGGGVIINIASTAGIGYGPHPRPEYAASKAGVVRLTGTLGYLREEIGVRVNCICPGWVETPEVRKYLSALSQEKRDELPIPPPNKLIQPEEIAELVMLFVDDDKLAGEVVVWLDGEPWRWVA